MTESIDETESFILNALDRWKKRLNILRAAILILGIMAVGGSIFVSTFLDSKDVKRQLKVDR